MMFPKSIPAEASYWFKCCRVVCSFALLENQQDVKFTRTIVDVDGSYVSKHKAAASNRDPCTLPENKGPYWLKIGRPLILAS